ncbi:hypothetical protein [Paracoccus chinensis]|uniref:Primase C terminal 1 (PriCT-1) n=1 Tax=Paracoccus chinensis TaxID=525640 RepID=A0A1G9LVW3_9RHOB|nr:hypothetical protein [Paracoccus chinensis]SDL66232.1 hypothetical protein SAMN04487971_1172 [Paracoccus chinensis]
MPSENASPGFCTGMGAFDTRANSDRPYEGVTWDDIVAMAENPRTVAKEEAQWIIPSYYRGPDARSHAVQRERGKFYALAFDIDEDNPSLEEVVAAVGKMLGGVQCLIYATRSAKPEARKWRGLLPLKQPLPGAWYGPMQDALFDGLEKAGLHPDRSLARTAQPIYLPNKGEHYESRLIEGPPLDIAAPSGLTSRAEAYAELQEAVSSGQARAEGPRSHLAAFRVRTH